jgi:hypothetical protein
VAHTVSAARRSDIRGDALKGHDGACACVFSYLSLIGRGNIHDYAALESFREEAVWGFAFHYIVLSHVDTID